MYIASINKYIHVTLPCGAAKDRRHSRIQRGDRGPDPSLNNHNGGPLIVAFGSSHQLKTKNVKVGPPLTELSGSAHGRTS